MDWSKLTPSEFEELCLKLIARAGFMNPTYYGGTGDRARDILAEYEYRLAGLVERDGYLFQCKRKLSGVLSISDIRSTKDWLDAGDFDKAVIITTTHVSPDTRDWIEAINEKEKYSIRIWDKSVLEIELGKYPDLMQEYFKETMITTVVSAKISSKFSTSSSSEVTFLTQPFQSRGGQIIVSGGLAAAGSISGSVVTFMARIDGKELNPQSFTLAGITQPLEVAWSKDGLPSGKHNLLIDCKVDSGSVQIERSNVKIIEAPKE